MVKRAGRITNLQPPPAHWSAAKIEHYREEAPVILDILGAAAPYLAERLRQHIGKYAN